jgi:hypothetical protein
MSTSDISSDFDRLHAELAQAVMACRADAGMHEVHSVHTGTRTLTTTMCVCASQVSIDL